MSLSHDQKRYIKKHLRSRSLEEIARSAKIPLEELYCYVSVRWPEKLTRHPVSKTSFTLSVPDDMRVWLRRNFVLIVLLVLLVAITYIWSLPNDLVSDDIPTLQSGADISSWSYLMRQPFMIMRFLVYAIPFKLAGATAWSFRLTTLFFHAGSTVLLFCIVAMMVSPVAALMVSSLFAIHPLLSESVIWISAGVYPQYTFFVLLSFLFYILAQNKKKYLTWSVVAFIAALFTSEKAMVGIGAFILFEAVRGNVRANWRRFLPLVVVTLVWGVLFFGFAGLFGARIQALSAMNYESAPLLNPFLQIPVAISSYLELFVWPDKLTFYHSEMQFGMVEYIVRLAVTIIFIASLIISYRKNKFIFFWLTWFIITLSPFLTPFGISWIVAERYVYLPAIGLYAVVGYGVYRLYQLHKYRTVALVVFSIIMVALMIRTIVRIGDWKNQDTLWVATARTSPSSHNNHNNLGDMYSRQGNQKKAIEEFNIAIALKPNYAEAYHNLGFTYEQTGKFDEAIFDFEKAVSINPRLWQSYQHLAAIYYQQKKFDQAKVSLEKALFINPNNEQLQKISRELQKL